MVTFRFTSIRRIVISIITIGYLFSSHYLNAGGLILQISAICLGLGLMTLLIASLASSSANKSYRGLFQEIMEYSS